MSAPGGVDRIEVERRRAAACRSFWSDHPLNLAYRRHIGRETFALKPVVAFVLSLPQGEFDACLI
jgi:hypothetical protein